MESKQNKWVIIFLIYADFIDSQNPKAPIFQSAYAQELDEFLKTLFETKFDTNKVDVYIVLGSLTYKKKNAAGEMKPFSSVDLFSFMPGDDPISYVADEGKGFIDETVPGKLGAFSIQRADTLGKIFFRVKERYTGQDNVKFILNTWDHGSAFGIFKSENHLLTITGFPEINESKFPTLFKLINKIPDDKKSSLPEMTDRSYNSFVQNNIVYKYTASKFSLKQIADLYNDKNILEFNKDNTKLFLKKEAYTPGIVMDEKLSNFIEEETHNSSEKVNILLNEFSKGIEVVPTGILEILTNEEIGRAIKIGFDDNIAVIAMMNCWMMNLHTLYALKDSTEYLVAPQGLISNPGYDYKTIIEKINTGSLSSQQIAETYITTSFDFKKRGIIDEETQLKIKCWALMVASVKDNKNIIENEIVKIVEDIAGIMKQNLDNAGSAIIREQKKSYLLFYTRACFNFSFGFRYFQIDLLNWIRTIEGFNSVLQSKSILDIGTTIQSVVLGRKIRTLFLKDDFFLKEPYGIFLDSQDTSFKGITRYPPNGISLYIPFNNNKGDIAENLFKGASNENEEENQLRLSSKIPKWIEFIELINTV